MAGRVVRFMSFKRCLKLNVFTPRVGTVPTPYSGGAIRGHTCLPAAGPGWPRCACYYSHRRPSAPPSGDPSGKAPALPLRPSSAVSLFPFPVSPDPSPRSVASRAAHPPGQARVGFALVAGALCGRHWPSQTGQSDCEFCPWSLWAEGDEGQRQEGGRAGVPGHGQD